MQITTIFAGNGAVLRASITAACAISLLLMPMGLSASTISHVTQAQILGIEGGWGENSVRVRFDTAFTNPGGCPSSDGYLTDPSQTGTSLFNSMLISAHLAGRPVALTIEGCYVGRPKIIGVQVL